MNEQIGRFIGKECLIYGMQTQITGVIESVEGNWITVSNSSGTELVNVDFITRIREYPKNKNGKKKSVVLD